MENNKDKAPLVFVTLKADDHSRKDWTFGMSELVFGRLAAPEEHKPVVNSGREIRASLYCPRTAEDIVRAKKELRDALADFYEKSLEAARTLLTEDPS